MRHRFRQYVGVPFPTFSTIRWHSRWEMVLRLWDVRHRVAAFLKAEGLSPTHPVRLPFTDDSELPTTTSQASKRRIQSVLSPKKKKKQTPLCSSQ